MAMGKLIDAELVQEWLIAYHGKSFELIGRYPASQVIGWVLNDYSKEFMGDDEDGKTD